MLAEPLKLTPAIVLAFCKTVALPALPVIVVCTTLFTTPKFVLAADAVLAPVPPLITDKSVPDQSLLLIASVPPKVILPELVTVPVRVNPFFVPVPLTLVTVPAPPETQGTLTTKV